MDRFRLIIAPKAAIDLSAIYDHIAEDSSENARKMCIQIMDAMELLEELPHRTIVSAQPPYSKDPIRSVVVRPYIVFFRAMDDEKIVRVVRIRHGARRPLKRFD
jgi:plasmid stabilization system protein ParE